MSPTLSVKEQGQQPNILHMLLRINASRREHGYRLQWAPRAMLMSHFTFGFVEQEGGGHMLQGTGRHLRKMAICHPHHARDVLGTYLLRCIIVVLWFCRY